MEVKLKKCRVCDATKNSQDFYPGRAVCKICVGIKTKEQKIKQKASQLEADALDKTTSNDSHTFDEDKFQQLSDLYERLNDVLAEHVNKFEVLNAKIISVEKENKLLKDKLSLFDSSTLESDIDQRFDKVNEELTSLFNWGETADCDIKELKANVKKIITRGNK